jgi:hypothetical protein
MAKEKLSPREEALLAEARREAAGQRDARSAPAAEARSAPQAKPPATPAERLAQLMLEERAESQRKKKNMRRYGIAISSGIAALFVLWLLRVLRRR